MAETSRETLIALGTNSYQSVTEGCDCLNSAIIDVASLFENKLKISGFFINPAFPAGAGPDFINAAIAVRTARDPRQILADLHHIETAAGRVRTQRWGQRRLDLDLIAVGDLVCPDLEKQGYWRNLGLQSQMTDTPEELILPHPRMQDRSFVLAPLADIAAGWLHPVLNMTVAQMLAARPAEERAEVVRLR